MKINITGVSHQFLNSRVPDSISEMIFTYETEEMADTVENEIRKTIAEGRTDDAWTMITFVRKDTHSVAILNTFHYVEGLLRDILRGTNHYYDSI